MLRLGLLLFVLTGIGVCLAQERSSLPANTTAPVATMPNTGITERICQAALAWFDEALKDDFISALVSVAEKAAERFIAEGDLYVTGNGGFCDELEYRAGGLPFTKFYTGQKLAANDVLFLGQFVPNERLPFYERMATIAGGNHRYNQGLVVVFANAAWPLAQRMKPAIDDKFWQGRLCMVDTRAPAGGEEECFPVAQMATVATAWALEGEILAAATRAGKTLATWSADAEPGSKDWDASVKDKHLHPSFSVPSQPAGKLAKAYLAACRAQLAKFAASQPGQVRAAAAAMAQAMARGGVVWTVVGGHLHLRGAVVPHELPQIYLIGRDYQWGQIARHLPAGDMLLHFGYLGYSRGMIDAALARGASAVAFSVNPGPADPRVVQVRTCWANYDTVVDLPDYPIRVLPSSGVVTTPQWYALMAETAAAMRLQGKTAAATRAGSRRE